MTLKLAAASVDHTTMSVVFDDNRASDAVTVMEQVETSTGVESGGGVNDFYPCFPFSTVYIHPGGNLLVEMQLWPVGDADYENRPSIVQDACDSRFEAGCTTARVWGINALASSGSMDGAPYGLVMKLIEASADEALQAIIDQITALELRMGIDQALSGPLGAAQASLADDRPATIRQLEAYVAQVEGLRGSQLTDEQADALVATAQALIDAINAGA